jgi:hypothetical protein
LAYDWTVRMAGDDQGGAIHTIRFYMPALGVIAALGAWLLAGGGSGQIGQPGGPGGDGLMHDGFPPGTGPGEDGGQEDGS